MDMRKDNGFFSLATQLCYLLLPFSLVTQLYCLWTRFSRHRFCGLPHLLTHSLAHSPTHPTRTDILHARTDA